MVKWLLNKIVGSKNQRTLKRMAPIVNKINEFDEQFKSYSDEQLREMTARWKEEISGIEDPQLQDNRLDEILPEAFAVVKNAARRLCDQTWDVCDQPITWEMVHFDVQLIGGITLHRGSISEMATGEGKTLVATLPVYLNALTGRGVHRVPELLQPRRLPLPRHLPDMIAYYIATVLSLINMDIFNVMLDNLYCLRLS